MKPIQFELKPEKYGKGLGILWRLGWGWEYYTEGHKRAKKKTTDPERDIDADEVTNFITVSDTIFPHLYAVSEKQAKMWKKQKFFYKFRWSKRKE